MSTNNSTHRVLQSCESNGGKMIEVGTIRSGNNDSMSGDDKDGAKAAVGTKRYIVNFTLRAFSSYTIDAQTPAAAIAEARRRYDAFDETGREGPDYGYPEEWSTDEVTS